MRRLMLLAGSRVARRALGLEDPGSDAPSVEQYSELPLYAVIGLAAHAGRIDRPYDIPFIVRTDAVGSRSAQCVVCAKGRAVDLLEVLVGRDRTVVPVFEFRHVVVAVQTEISREI